MHLITNLSDIFLDSKFINGNISGTKTTLLPDQKLPWFYDDSILPGTKTNYCSALSPITFYDDSILPGTKTTPS